MRGPQAALGPAFTLLSAAWAQPRDRAPRASRRSSVGCPGLGLRAHVALNCSRVLDGEGKTASKNRCKDGFLVFFKGMRKESEK